MNNLTNKQTDILSSLKKQLNSFSLLREFSIWVILGIGFILGAIIAIALGEMLLMIIIIGGGLIVEHIGIKISDTKKNKQQYAYDVCLLMDDFLSESIEKDRKIGDVVISTAATLDNNRGLYKRFTKACPEMKSFKLWYLSGIKTR